MRFWGKAVLVPLASSVVTACGGDDAAGGVSRVACGVLAACAKGGGDAGGREGGSDPEAGRQSPDGAAPCDLLSQAGCDSGEKCVALNNGVEAIITCAPIVGSVAPGGECSYDEDGHDDCVRGADCTAWGIGQPDNAPRTLKCRTYCARDDDCTASGEGAQFCMSFAANCQGSATCGAELDVGLCLERCSPFGTDCGPNGTCTRLVTDIDLVNEYPVCRSVGSVTAGSPCEWGEDCGPDMTCIQRSNGQTLCARLCDSSHPCSEGICSGRSGHTVCL